MVEGRWVMADEEAVLAGGAIEDLAQIFLAVRAHAHSFKRALGNQPDVFTNTRVILYFVGLILAQFDRVCGQGVDSTFVP